MKKLKMGHRIGHRMICICLVLFGILKQKKALKIIGFKGLYCKMSFRFRTLVEPEGFEPSSSEGNYRVFYMLILLLIVVQSVVKGNR